MHVKHGKNEMFWNRWLQIYLQSLKLWTDYEIREVIFA